MANAPVSKTNTAKPGNPNAAPAAGSKKNLGFGFNTDTGQAFSSAEERAAAGEAGEMAAREFPSSPAASPTKPAPTGKKPVRVRSKKAAQPAPQQQMASKINTGSMVLEGFSLFRKK